MIRDQKVKGGTYRPLIVVRPDGDIGGLDVCRAEEGEGPFRRNNVNFDVAVLESNVRKRVFLRKAAPTSRSSRTMGLYGCDTAGGDEQDVGMVRGALDDLTGRYQSNLYYSHGQPLTLWVLVSVLWLPGNHQSRVRKWHQHV
jgi:hypothetical protein